MNVQETPMKRDTREAAARRALGIAIKARSKHNRPSAQNVPGTAVGGSVEHEQTIVWGNTTYHFIPRKERGEYPQYNYRSECGKRIAWSSSRVRVLLVKLKPSPVEYQLLPGATDMERAVFNTNKRCNIIPEGFRKPTDATDTQTFGHFAHWCKKNALTFATVSMIDTVTREYASKEDMAQFAQSVNHNGWYTISGTAQAMADALGSDISGIDTTQMKRFILPWHIVRCEQPVNASVGSTGIGTGKFSVSAEKRTRKAKRDAIAYWEDNAIHKRIDVHHTDYALQGKLIGLLVSQYGFSPTDSSIDVNGWAFNAFLEMGNARDEMKRLAAQHAIRVYSSQYRAEIASRFNAIKLRKSTLELSLRNHSQVLVNVEDVIPIHKSAPIPDNDPYIVSCLKVYRRGDASDVNTIHRIITASGATEREVKKFVREWMNKEQQ